MSKPPAWRTEVSGKCVLDVSPYINLWMRKTSQNPADRRYGIQILNTMHADYEFSSEDEAKAWAVKTLLQYLQAAQKRLSTMPMDQAEAP